MSLAELAFSSQTACQSPFHFIEVRSTPPSSQMMLVTRALPYQQATASKTFSVGKRPLHICEDPVIGSQHSTGQRLSVYWRGSQCRRQADSATAAGSVHVAQRHKSCSQVRCCQPPCGPPGTACCTLYLDSCRTPLSVALCIFNSMLAHHDCVSASDDVSARH